jgi:hypothetical protein
MLLAGCNFSVPQVTPTVAPTRETTRTPEPSPTASTLPPTRVIQQPTDTPTRRQTATPTATFTPSATITDTPAPTETPAVSSTPTIDLTLLAQYLTPADVRPLPTSTPAAPSTPQLILPSPVPATPQLIVPTPIAVTAVAAVPNRPPAPALPAPNGSTRLVGLSTDGSGVGVSGVEIGDPNQWSLFVQNPANPNQFVVVNTAGLPYFVDDYNRRSIDRVGMTNYTEFHYQVSSRADNDKPVSVMRFAADGTLALLIDGDKNLDDGVWMYAPDYGLTQQVLRECWHPAICENVYDYEGLGEWEAVDLAWSPDSRALLIMLDLPREGRRAYVVVERRGADPTVVPPAHRYDYASWSPDSQRIIVSGRSPDGSIMMGWIGRDGRGARTVNMRSLGYNWVRDAVEYNGRIYGFASREGAGGTLVLVDEAGRALTGALGSNPERISWSPDNSAALLVFNQGRRRYFVVNLDERVVEEITSRVANANTIDWVVTR